MRQLRCRHKEGSEILYQLRHQGAEINTFIIDNIGSMEVKMKNTTTIPEIVPLIMATAALCLTLTGCGAGSTEINLSDYIVFSTEGYDTFGTAECWFDDESYTNDVESILAEKDVWNEKKSSQEKMDLALSLYLSSDGAARPGQETVKSSTARPAWRSSTVICRMSAPISPKARATWPSAPGRSGSETRNRRSMRITSSDCDTSDSAGGTFRGCYARPYPDDERSRQISARLHGVRMRLGPVAARRRPAYASGA